MNNKTTFQSSFTSTVCPEIVLYGVQTQSLSKMVDELCGKGLIIFNILKVVQAVPTVTAENNTNENDTNKSIKTATATIKPNELDNTYIITLRISSKLYLKLCDVYSKRNHQKMVWEPEESITERERLIPLIRCRICYKVESIIQNISSMKYSMFELLHNGEALNGYEEKTTSGSINNEDTLQLNDYFGPSTCLYFTWLQYLHQCSWPSSLLCLFTALAFKYHLFPFVCVFNTFGLSCTFAYFRHKLTHQLAYQLSPLRYSQESDSEYASLVGKPLETALSRMFYIALSWLTTAILARIFISLSLWTQYLFLPSVSRSTSLLGSATTTIIFYFSLIIICSGYFVLTTFIACLLENAFIHKFARFEKHALVADTVFSVVLKKVLYRVAIYAAWVSSLLLGGVRGNHSKYEDKHLQNDMIYTSVEISLLFMFLLHTTLAPLIKKYSLQLHRGDEDDGVLIASQPCVVLCKLTKKTGYIREHILENDSFENLSDGNKSSFKKSSMVSRMRYKLVNKLAAHTSGRDNAVGLRDSPVKSHSPLTLTQPVTSSTSSSTSSSLSTTAMSPQSPITPDNTSSPTANTSAESRKMKRLLKHGCDKSVVKTDDSNSTAATSITNQTAGENGEYQTKTNCIYFDDRFLQEDDITKNTNNKTTNSTTSPLRKSRAQPNVSFLSVVDEEGNFRRKSLVRRGSASSLGSATSEVDSSSSAVITTINAESSSMVDGSVIITAINKEVDVDVDGDIDVVDDTPVNKYHFSESIAVTAAGTDYEVMPLSNQDSLLIQESALPSFRSQHKQTELLTLLVITLLFAPFSALLYPAFSVYLVFTYKQHMMELLRHCRRPVIDENTRGCLVMEPFLILAENFSIVAIVTTLSVFYCMVSLWEGAEVPIPQELMVGLTSIKYIIVGRAVTDTRNSNHSSVTSSNGNTGYTIHTYVLLILVEHLAILFRVYILPRFLSFSVGHSRRAINALERMKEIRENVASRMMFLKDVNLKTVVIQLREATAIYDQWRAMIKLAEIQSHIGSSMNPYLWGVLSLVPFILHTYFDIAWYLTFVPLFLTCSYYQNHIDRRKRAIAMSMICDTTVFQYIQRELPGFVFDADLQRCEWVNTMLQLTWPQLAQYAENKVRKIVMPALEDNCPPIARRLYLSKLTMGNNPFTVLGMRVLEGKGRRSDFVELDVDFKWVSNLTMAITMELKVGSVFTLNVTNFQFSGTVRIMCCEKIPANPPFVYAKATFFEKPFVDFSLAFGDTDLMELGPSHGSISTLIQGILKHVLQTMVIYPKWMRIELNDPPEGHAPAPKDPFVITHPEGVLNIIVLNCRNLIIGDISTSDPYVIVRLGQETYTTPVIYKTLNPVWEGANYNFLVHDKSREFLDIEVYDKDQTQKDEFLGKTKVYLDPLLDGSQEKYTLDLMDVRHGKITIALAYMKLAESKKNSSMTGGGAGVQQQETGNVASDGGSSNSSSGEMSRLPHPQHHNHTSSSTNNNADINLDDLINMTIGNLSSSLENSNNNSTSASVIRSGSPLKKQSSSSSVSRGGSPLRRSLGQRSASGLFNNSSSSNNNGNSSSSRKGGTTAITTEVEGNGAVGPSQNNNIKLSSSSLSTSTPTSASKTSRKSISSYLFSSSQNKLVAPISLTEGGDNSNEDGTASGMNANNIINRKLSGDGSQRHRSSSSGFGMFRTVAEAAVDADNDEGNAMMSGDVSSPRDGLYVDGNSSYQQSHITVAGILTVSNINLNKLFTMKGMVSSSHKITSYCSFNVGHTRRSTIEKYKDANPHFPETFHFVVGDKDQDVLQIKIKQVTNIVGLVKTLAVVEVRVKNVVVSANQCLHVTEDISTAKDKNTTTLLALGAGFTCELKYRPTARLYSIANNFAK